jgi:hypothetical protein
MLQLVDITHGAPLFSQVAVAHHAAIAKGGVIFSPFSKVPILTSGAWCPTAISHSSDTPRSGAPLQSLGRVVDQTES